MVDILKAQARKRNRQSSMINFLDMKKVEKHVERKSGKKVHRVSEQQAIKDQAQIYLFVSPLFKKRSSITGWKALRQVAENKEQQNQAQSGLFQRQGTVQSQGSISWGFKSQMLKSEAQDHLE